MNFDCFALVAHNADVAGEPPRNGKLLPVKRAGTALHRLEVRIPSAAPPGESSGPEGARDAIELLGADRIDHGVRAIEDDAAVALLAERGIPLGVCPNSNIALEVYSSMEAHPLDRLRRAGVRVSINTDDPSLLGTNLPREYEIARATYGWTEDVLREPPQKEPPEPLVARLERLSDAPDGCAPCN